MFSATDDLCLHLPAANWKHLGSQLKYRDDAGNSAQIQDGQLRVRIRGPGPLGYTLDETTQGTVNAIFTSGTTGDRWCMQWTAALPPTRDEPGRYLARNAAAPGSCPAEPSDCPAVHTLSLTTTVGTSDCGPPGLIANPAPPCSGEIDSDTACTTELSCLGLGCLYIGDGNATYIPGGKVPDGATTVFSLSGTTLSANSGSGPSDCSQGAGPGKHCVNNNATPSCAANGDCGGTAGACALDAHCYFGPPLPILRA